HVAVAVLRRARRRHLRRLRPGGLRGDMERARLAVAAPVVQGRGPEPRQQPEADQLGHDDHRRQRGPEGRERSAARVHYRAEVRRDDKERRLSASSSGAGWRTDVSDVVRLALLTLSMLNAECRMPKAFTPTRIRIRDVW